MKALLFNPKECVGTEDGCEFLIAANKAVRDKVSTQIEVAEIGETLYRMVDGAHPAKYEPVSHYQVQPIMERLEKENASLKEKLKGVAEIGETLWRKSWDDKGTVLLQEVTHRRVTDSDAAQVVRMCEKIKELEKENTKLQKKIGAEVETAPGSGVYESWTIIHLRAENARLKGLMRDSISAGKTMNDAYGDLIKENAELKRLFNERQEVIKSLIAAKDAWIEVNRGLAGQIQDLKKNQVVWGKYYSEGRPTTAPGQAYVSNGVVVVRIDDHVCTIPLPAPEVPKAKSEAEEAWEKYESAEIGCDKFSKMDFIAGYRAREAKESK